MKTVKHLPAKGMYAYFFFLFFFILFSFLTAPLTAQTVQWNFSGGAQSGSSSAGYISPGTALTGPGTSTSGFPDEACSNNEPWSVRGWFNTNSLSDAQTNGDYVSFSLSVGSGESFHITGVSFRSNRSVSVGGTEFGPLNWAVFSSADGYATALFSGTNPSGTTGTSASCNFHSQTVDIPLNGGQSVTFRVYAYGDASSNISTMRIDDFTITGTALPIELGAFTAREADGGVQLTWQTYQEESNAYIAIERSADGQWFREIGQVAGNGTTYQTRDYFYIDEQPLPGLNYYRLRQVDFDGASYIHHTVSVRIRSNNEQIRFFPTLVSSHLTLQYPESQEQTGRLIIFNALGQSIQRMDVPQGALQQQFNISDLSPGTYILQYREGRKVEVLGRFVKQ